MGSRSYQAFLRAKAAAAAITHVEPPPGSTPRTRWPWQGGSSGVSPRHQGWDQQWESIALSVCLGPRPWRPLHLLCRLATGFMCSFCLPSADLFQGVERAVTRHLASQLRGVGAASQLREQTPGGWVTCSGRLREPDRVMPGAALSASGHSATAASRLGSALGGHGPLHKPVKPAASPEKGLGLNLERPGI